MTRTETIRAAMSLLGQAKSPKKADQARRNLERANLAKKALQEAKGGHGPSEEEKGRESAPIAENGHTGNGGEA